MSCSGKERYGAPVELQKGLYRYEARCTHTKVPSAVGTPKLLVCKSQIKLFPSPFCCSNFCINQLSSHPANQLEGPAPLSPTFLRRPNRPEESSTLGPCRGPVAPCAGPLSPRRAPPVLQTARCKQPRLHEGAENLVLVWCFMHFSHARLRKPKNHSAAPKLECHHFTCRWCILHNSNASAQCQTLCSYNELRQQMWGSFQIFSWQLVRRFELGGSPTEGPQPARREAELHDH